MDHKRTPRSVCRDHVESRVSTVCQIHRLHRLCVNLTLITEGEKHWEEGHIVKIADYLDAGRPDFDSQLSSLTNYITLGKLLYCSEPKHSHTVRMMSELGII